MTKLKFLLELEKKLSGLPQQDIEEQLTFYCEMIEDRVEEGISEEEAVAQIGTVEDIAAQILSEHTVGAPIYGEEMVTAEELPAAEEKVKHTFKTWELVLLIAGSPIWLSLLIAALAVGFSFFVVFWAVVISLWAVVVSLAACAVALPIAAVYFICTGYAYSGLVVIATSLVCGGLGILFCYVCKCATKGMALVTKVAAISLIKCFGRKEEV